MAGKLETDDLLELLISRIESNPNESRMTWRSRVVTCRGDSIFNAKYAGKYVGCESVSTSDGSLRFVFSMRVDGKDRTFIASRVKWAIHNKRWPCGEIDHVDGNSLNDKIENLRDSSTKANSANKGKYSTNTSGIKGVRYNKKIGKWTARITHNYQEIHIGCFLTPEEAASAYMMKSIELNGEYARIDDHNRDSLVD
ncbi:DNA-binding protein [Shigella phage Sd1]|uniref:DNA-binding protein n=1 Tax=Shigella phage Sd1 TaxID=2024313 RepID=A0A291AYM0_9CAUD|nr:HNH endonuclease [Shigella phage Sd1]ATE86109.1 DNA-binding protein [Shigella phage Sd1]